VVRIDWEDDERGACFELDWLAAHAFGGGQRDRSWRPGVARGAGLLATRDFRLGEPCRGARGLAGAPHLVDAAAAGRAGLPEWRAGAGKRRLLEAIPLVGRVLETNYGLTFDVRSVPQPRTSPIPIRLGLHTDNPYRDPVPGFQALHALIPSSEGGESSVRRRAWRWLSTCVPRPGRVRAADRTAVPFHYRSRDADLYAERPPDSTSVRGRGRGGATTTAVSIAHPECRRSDDTLPRSTPLTGASPPCCAIRSFKPAHGLGGKTVVCV